MAKGDYYNERSYPAPYPDLFEAGHKQRAGFEVAEPMAQCEYPVSVLPSRMHPSGEASCRRPAIANISYSTGKMPVCRGHLEKIKEAAQKRGQCECTYREPQYDDGEYDWQRQTAPECPIHEDNEGGE